MPKNACDYRIGQSVSYKSSGKIARLEGKSGKIVTGVITSLTEHGLSVLPDHRTVPGVFCYNMQASLSYSQVR